MGINWKWPSKRGNDYLPWYVILRRLLLVGPAIVSLAVFCFFIGLMLGVRRAADAWRNNI
ncbi:MAG: hypothetical protein A4E20_01335 [Nitrospira sp. SG-bin2]|nr:MAG: hypothetical protein A4E20_01335 [Nitrospira sp. SG-bin2]